MKTKFKQWEVDYIFANYPKKTITEIAKILNRPFNSVSAKAYRNGLKKKQLWSSAEIRQLKQNYEKYTPKELTKIILRSKSSITTKLYELGLKVGKEIRSQRIKTTFNNKRQLFESQDFAMCISCKKDKPINDFAVASEKRFGNPRVYKLKICKECVKNWHRKYYLSHDGNGKKRRKKYEGIEIMFVQENYTQMTSGAMAELLGIPKGTVKSIMIQLKLKNEASDRSVLIRKNLPDINIAKVISGDEETAKIIVSQYPDLIKLKKANINLKKKISLNK